MYLDRIGEDSKGRPVLIIISPPIIDVLHPRYGVVFEGQVVPGWKEQVTIRPLAVSVLLGSMFSIIVMKLNLTAGIIPSLNISAGLLGFFLLTSWTKLLNKIGVPRVRPFTRQENTIV